MDRRDLLKRAAAALGLGATTPVMLAITACSDRPTTKTTATDPAAPEVESLNVPARASVFDKTEREMIEILVELIIPTTDTPGAAKAGVGGFIDTMVTDWYTDQERQRFIKGLGLLDDHCLLSFNQNFLSCSENQRIATLEEAEQNLLGVISDRQTGNKARRIPATEPGPWNDLPKGGAEFFEALKQLTILGYYTSEIGSTQELIYDPVPGSYDGDVDFYEQGRHYTR